MTTDFRDNVSSPRRGRGQIGPFLWLARVIDKARASAERTIGEYIYPCPIDKGMLLRWGISSAQFDEAIKAFSTDEGVVNWLRGRVSPEVAEFANDWLVEEWRDNLDRQDFEECALSR